MINTMNDKYFDLPSTKQDKMINAALSVFGCNDYKHSSTDEIVKRAGISKGLLFHYFTSKDGLYSYLLDYSVRYLLNEYNRIIGDEKEYFAFYEKMEMAKLNVLRNYPYMFEFIERSISEPSIDIREKSQAAINTYSEAMTAYRNRLVLPELNSGLDMTHLDNIVSFTIQGLTAKQLASGNPDPDVLFEQIGNYMDIFKTMLAK